MPKPKAKDSEVHAYEFVKANLRLLGWDVRNPERADGGQVWTQNECLSNPEIKRCLGLDRPENIVKVTEDTLWIIEAKRSHGELQKALDEAEYQYAAKFGGSNIYKVGFISGVAGNEIDSFLVRTKYFDGKQFVPVTLNGIEATGLLRQSELVNILKTGNPDIAEPEIDERLFISRAEHINEILHLGAVNPHQRAGVMAALLLSMLSHTPPNIDERRPDVLINDINGRVQSILRDQGKSEFYDYIKIKLPSTIDNHVKLRRALVDTLQELNNLNIRSAMNSGADWLGAFYEVFLKYASWAQDLGIVLTPRHLTRWVADVMDVKVHDIIYDPTCGTGGFLVAAFDYVKQNSDPTQLLKFKQNSVFGIEQDAGVAALAVVNMIFRGDGKNNIHEGNCFSKYLDAHIEKDINTAKFLQKQSDNPPVTKVMMNPPFALKRSDEKEFRFIDQALSQIEHGGLLFSVLPYSVMVKPGIYYTWRRESLLPNHSLLSVVTFPIDIFYPVGVTTVGIFIRKGIPHPIKQNVLWIRALTDGLLKSKGKRLPSSRTTNELEESKALLKAFLNDLSYTVPNIAMRQKACPIDFSDPLLELVPENYLDEPTPSPDDIQNGIEDIVRESVAFLIRTRRESELKSE
jgi:type I restriction enzyme M protein